MPVHLETDELVVDLIGDCVARQQFRMRFALSARAAAVRIVGGSR